MSHEISVLELSEESFPLEIFGYPEGSSSAATPIYHCVVQKPDGTTEVLIPMPKQRMRMKVVCANGDVLEGTERS